MGRLLFVNPHGMEMPGIPARFAEIVKMSERYIVSGSLIFSPILNAAVGEVGVIIASNFLNASSKSFFIKSLPLTLLNNMRHNNRLKERMSLK